MTVSLDVEDLVDGDHRDALKSKLSAR